ncbi:hypothetical protein WJX74_006182 [Apatococcus lobatus]
MRLDIAQISLQLMSVLDRPGYVNTSIHRCQMVGCSSTHLAKWTVSGRLLAHYCYNQLLLRPASAGWTGAPCAADGSADALLGPSWAEPARCCADALPQQLDPSGGAG